MLARANQRLRQMDLRHRWRGVIRRCTPQDGDCGFGIAGAQQDQPLGIHYPRIAWRKGRGARGDNTRLAQIPSLRQRPGKIVQRMRVARAFRCK